jgi:hypothetical protein
MLNSQREIVVLDAPSNLGLRPPGPGVVPGVYKLAGALRDKRSSSGSQPPTVVSSCRRGTSRS